MSKKYINLINKLKKSQNNEEIYEIIENLSQLESNFEDKIIDDCEIKNIKNIVNQINNIEFAESLNSKTCLDLDTKLVIVGTITPYNGKKCGYYYTSNRNKVYGIIDKYFGLSGKDNSLVSLKKQLIIEENEDKKKIIIDKIISILKTLNIAFIDVVKSSLRVKNNARDDRIILFNLDYEIFRKTNHIENFICTSKNAKICLDKILDKLKFSNKKIEICNQGWPQYKWEVWQNSLDKIFNI